MKISEGKMEYGCGCGIEEGRAFLTKEEKADILETYKNKLLKEVQGIEETIDKIKKAG